MPKTVVTVAVDEFWTDRQSGERKKRTEFLTAFTFNAKIGGFLEVKVNIGDQITIDGHIRANSYERNGERVDPRTRRLTRLADSHCTRNRPACVPQLFLVQPAWQFPAVQIMLARMN